MPKTMSVLLREEFERNGYELLDIYRFKDHDLVRFRHKLTGRVYVASSKIHVSDLASPEEIHELVGKLVKEALGEKEK